MNASIKTSRNAVSSYPPPDYEDLVNGLAHRIMDGIMPTYQDGMLLMQVVGALGYANAENRRLRDEAQTARIAQIRGRQQTPAQQWQARAAQDSIEHWMLAQSSDFDAFLSTSEGEAWLEQQGENLADPYFT